VPQAPADHKDHKAQTELLAQEPLVLMELQVQPELVPPELLDHRDLADHKEYLGLLEPLVPAA
jgi:hypothetical protein